MVEEEAHQNLVAESRIQQEELYQKDKEYSKLQQDFIDLQTYTNLEIDAIEEELDKNACRVISFIRAGRAKTKQLQV